MAQPKMLRRLIRELETYFKRYGDVPCYIAIGDTMTGLTDSGVGSVQVDDSTDTPPASMNVVVLCDRDAFIEAQRESDDNEAIEDSDYGE